MSLFSLNGWLCCANIFCCNKMKIQLFSDQHTLNFLPGHGSHFSSANVMRDPDNFFKHAWKSSDHTLGISLLIIEQFLFESWIYKNTLITCQTWQLYFSHARRNWKKHLKSNDINSFDISHNKKKTEEISEGSLELRMLHHRSRNISLMTSRHRCWWGI